MDPSTSPPTPDPVRLTVDGEVFDVVYDRSQPGAYHYSWLTGTNPGYGFTSRRSDHGTSTTDEHVAGIRTFLGMVDPSTGYIEDPPEDDLTGPASSSEPS